jgi:hypothetical protein
LKTTHQTNPTTEDKLKILKNVKDSITEKTDCYVVLKLENGKFTNHFYGSVEHICYLKTKLELCLADMIRQIER